MINRIKTPLLAVVIREAKGIRHNPAYRFLLFTGPLIGLLLLFFIFRQGTVNKLPVALVNQDKSTLSLNISNAIDASPDVQIIARPQDMFLAEKMMTEGKIEAIILIPQNTEKFVYQGTNAPIPVYINGTNVLKSGIVQRSVLTTLKTISGGLQVRKLMLTGKNETQAMARVMPIKIQKHVLFNPYTNYNYFLNSAMLYVMLYLFVFLSSIYTLGNELKRGTGLELLKTGNGSVRLAVAGKMIPYTIIFSCFAMLINFLLFSVEGMPINGNYWIIFWGQFITIITYQLMGLIFVGATINLRLALSLGSAYSIMGVTFSGLTFPLEAMPLAGRIFSAFFPFTWWEKIIISQSLRGTPASEALLYISYILVFFLVSIAFLKLYKRYLGDAKYWGKS